ncbi:MAG: Tetratricopeptide 2 repeat protein [Phycisphaerales bacterium]|nr:Tetratricopeptide 2 repeat protein [Phycisphaerales bacterium]
MTDVGRRRGVGEHRAEPVWADPQRRRMAAGVMGLLLLTAIVMGGLCGNEFVFWDDRETISNNPRLNPPSWASVGYYWRHGQMGLYVPVTYTVWSGLAAGGQLDAPDPVRGVRLNPWVFHTFNVAVHGVNVLLVFAILRLLVGQGWGAWLGAALFAVHPVQVEPVAWASGTKDLLCGTFSLVAVWQYVLYATRNHEGRVHTTGVAGDGGWGGLPQVAHYLIGLFALVLGELSKPTAMVTPAIVAAIDFWLVGRPVRRVARDAGIWLAAALPLMIVARVVQSVAPEYVVPLWARPLLAGFSVSYYFGKLVAPVRLAFDYGWRPLRLVEHGWFYAAWLAPVAIGVVAWRFRRRWPAVWVGGLVFVAGVAPVLGITQFMYQEFSQVADHYLYLAMLGPAITLAWAVGNAPAAWRGRVVAAAALWLALLGVRAVAQVPVWCDTLSLASHNIAVNPASFGSYNNLGAAYDLQGAALEREGSAAEARACYGRSIDAYRHALDVEPTHQKSWANLAMAYVRRAGVESTRTGQVADLREAARLIEARMSRPGWGTQITPAVLGEIYSRSGDWAEAARWLAEAVVREPGNRDAAERLAAVRAKLPAGTTVPATAPVPGRPAMAPPAGGR